MSRYCLEVCVSGVDLLARRYADDIVQMQTEESRLGGGKLYRRPLRRHLFTQYDAPLVALQGRFKLPRRVHVQFVYFLDTIYCLNNAPRGYWQDVKW